MDFFIPATARLKKSSGTSGIFEALISSENSDDRIPNCSSMLSEERARRQVVKTSAVDIITGTGTTEEVNCSLF